MPQNSSRKNRNSQCLLAAAVGLVLALSLQDHLASAFHLMPTPRARHHRHSNTNAALTPSRRSSRLNARETNTLTETTAGKRNSMRTQADEFPEMTLELTQDEEKQEDGFSYATFAQTYPFANNVGIATLKTAAADLLAQTVIAQTPVSEIDWQRSLLFCLFGATYLGGFQYWYQVNIFKKMFDVDQFTNKSWSDKLKDTKGLKALAAQTALDLGVLTAIYLPTFYMFKASVFSGSADPIVWASTGLDNYQMNFAKDEFDLLRVWFPADLICFSVPLYLRLPVRHVVSFVWTAYLSFSRGGH